MPEPTESAVIVAVPAAELAVRAHRRQFDTAAAWGVPAQVTVLYPFVPPSQIGRVVLATLANVVAAVPRFSADWNTTNWFGQEVLWLAPEPGASFRALTTAVSQAFPNYLPYEGQFDDVVPHLTVGDKGSAEELRTVEREVLSHLPISMAVTHVQVICGTTVPDSWQTIGEFPLG
jgi:2'-5' RNA ligase